MDHRSFSNMSEKPLRIKGSLIKGLKADLCQFADCPAGDCLVRKLIDLLIFIRVKKSVLLAFEHWNILLSAQQSCRKGEVLCH